MKEMLLECVLANIVVNKTKSDIRAKKCLFGFAKEFPVLSLIVSS